MKRIILLLLFLFILFKIYGQTTDTIPAYNLGEVIVTAKNENIVKASSIIEVDFAQMQRSLASTVTDAISMEAGIRTQVNSKGEIPVYIRGFSQKQIAVFIDGIPVYFPYEGELDLNQIPTASIEKITISKGMPSILYGPNSMGGTVNIITQENREGFGFGASFQTGSKQSISLNTRGEFLNLKWNVGGQFNKSSGFYLPGSFNNTVNEDGNRRDNSHYENLGGFLRLTHSPSKNIHLSYSLFLTDNSRGIPPNIYSIRPRYWKFTEWKKYLHSFAFNVFLGKSFAVKGNLFYDKYRNVLDSYDDNTYTTQTLKSAFHSTYDDNSRGLNLTSFINPDFFPLTKLTMLYKADIHREQGNIQLPWGEYKTETLTIGIEQEFNLTDKLFGVTGISYDRMNPLFANNAPLRSSCSVLNGHAGLNYEINNWLNFHAHASKKSRFPTLKEFYSEVLGRNIANPDLSVEKSMNYEVGFKIDIKTENPLKLIFFFSDVKDMIQLLNLPDGIRQFQNLGKVQLAGFETEVGLDASIFDSKINYTFLSAKNLSVNAINRILDNRPKHVLNIINSKKYPPGFEWIIESSFVNSRYSSDGDTGEFIKMPDYFLLNVKLSQKFFEQYYLAAGITNILGKYYESEYGFPQPGREYILQLGISL
jgi:outer membrane cobalamin receptor